MIPYTFILGMSHSGSTLLAFLLNAHPEIVSVGETSRVTELLPGRWKPGNDRCSCGENYYACPFWNRTLAGMAVRGHGIGEPDFFVYGRRQKKTADARLKAFAESALDVAGARVFLDASKHHQLVRPLVRNSHLDLRLIDLYRDGRGVINSWRKNQSDPDLGRIVQRFVRQEGLRARARALVPPDRRHAVRYEALASNPRETLREIFAFMGVDTEVDVTKGYKTRAEHHIIGNRMRLDGDETIVFDEKWRQELPPEWRTHFARAGGEAVNRGNGYGD